ncbi:hypothetical protein GCM10023187_02170 [Nibrella viscosa]|uniref:Uncharacterized protein n=1 Tax=Nibrella viscosa TaxID=1084524 RepID=A0ABP8JSG8_9BACT
MASFQAMLQFSTGDSGEGIMLNRVNFFAVRDRDSKGRPVAKAAWTMMVSLYAIRDKMFTEWMLDPFKKKDLTIAFLAGDQNEKEKEWQFKDVYCIGFEENFVEDLGIFETIVILSGESVSNGNATLSYNWAS